MTESSTLLKNNLNLGIMLNFIADSKDGVIGNGWTDAAMKSAINTVDRAGGVNKNGKGDGKLSVHDAANIALDVIKTHPNLTFKPDLNEDAFMQDYLKTGITSRASEILYADDALIFEKNLNSPFAEQIIIPKKSSIPGYSFITPEQPSLPTDPFAAFSFNKDPIVLDGFNPQAI
jgi:hypothetical protein